MKLPAAPKIHGIYVKLRGIKADFAEGILPAAPKKTGIYVKLRRIQIIITAQFYFML